MNARYAPMNRSHIPGFPNPMPKVDWLEDLPIFKDEKKDNAALHLVRFHMHVRSLKVHFPEDCLMRMFMATLEGKAWSWYKSLENGSLSSLADFHDVFYDTYKECHPSLLLLKDCCRHSLSLIQYLEDCYDDDEFMDEEILEALHNNAFQHQGESITSHETQHEDQQGFTYENHVQSSDIDVEMQQTCQSSDHYQNEHDYKHQEEMLEEIFYDPQAEEKIVHFCNFLQQLTPKNDDNNEENSIVCWNDSEKQLDSLSNKCCVVEDQLFEDIECYDDHQNNHVFFDPISEYMAKLCTPVFHFHLHYEDQVHYKLIWSSHYHGYFEVECSQEPPISERTIDWLYWKYHVA